MLLQKSKKKPVNPKQKPDMPLADEIDDSLTFGIMIHNLTQGSALNMPIGADKKNLIRTEQANR